MILWRINGNYAKIILDSGLLLRFHEYGDVHAIHLIKELLGTYVKIQEKVKKS